MINLLKNMELPFLICFISGSVTILIISILILLFIIYNIKEHIKMYYLFNSEDYTNLKIMFSEIFAKQTEEEKDEFQKTEKYSSKKTYRFDNKLKGKRK